MFAAPCPVPGCLRTHRREFLCCRVCWSTIRGQDGGALARRIYEAVAAFRHAPNAETQREMLEVQAEGIQKAAQRIVELREAPRRRSRTRR